MTPRSTATTVEILEVGNPALLQDVFRLRVSVWRISGVTDSRLSGDVWTDAHDSHAKHWAAIDDGQLLASARLCVHSSVAELPESHLYPVDRLSQYSRLGSMNRLVVVPNIRRRGVAHKIDQVRIEAAKAAGCECIVCWLSPLSGRSRYRSLQKCGFVTLAPMNSVQSPLGPATPMILDLRDAP